MLVQCKTTTAVVRRPPEIELFDKVNKEDSAAGEHRISSGFDFLRIEFLSSFS